MSNNNLQTGLSKVGNEADKLLKPKITVPIWVVLVAFGAGQILMKAFGI